MNRTDEINHELNELGSPLANQPRRMPYAVPQGYFDALVNDLLIGISSAPDPALSFPKTMPYAVPAGYFEQLPGAVTEHIFAEGERFSIPAATVPYSVPEGYFDTFSVQLMSRIREAENTPVTPAAPERKTIPLFTYLKPMRWAAAALVVIGLSVGGYRLYEGQQRNASPVAMLEKTDKGVIADYVSQNIDDFDSDMLEDNAVASLAPVSQSGVPSFSKDDIQQYLDQNGG